MNINFEKNNIIFNYRVGIIIRYNDKILVQKDKKVDYYTIPGGRCELNETSTFTAIREFKEETGIDTELVRPMGMIENFFYSNFVNKNYHEILIIHELKFKDNNYYNLKEIHNIEEKHKDNVIYEWISINELSNFKPKIILSMLDNKEFSYYINKD